jgi:hypothetical protein
MSLPLTNVTTKSPLNILNTYDITTSLSHNNCNFHSIELMSISIESPQPALSAIQRWIDPDTGNPNVSRYTDHNLEMRTSRLSSFFRKDITPQLLKLLRHGGYHIKGCFLDKKENILSLRMAAIIPFFAGRREGDPSLVLAPCHSRTSYSTAHSSTAC